MCGEKLFVSHFDLLLSGSPPRVWGKVSKVDRLVSGGRITPTCVGKSKRTVLKHIMDEDHPHVCGEKAESREESTVILGSPPRVWGKVILMPN